MMYSVEELKVLTFHTNENKDLIYGNINQLSNDEKTEGYLIIFSLKERGIEALLHFDTRQISGKHWEIKFWRHNR